MHIHMISIDDIRRPILADIEAFDEFVSDNFSAEGELMQEMLTYALSSRGKGVRPILTMLSALLYVSKERALDGEGKERNCSKRKIGRASCRERVCLRV